MNESVKSRHSCGPTWMNCLLHACHPFSTLHEQWLCWVNASYLPWYWTFRIPDWQLVRSQVAYLFNNWVPILPLAPRLKPLVFLNLCNKKKWSPNRLIFLFCIVMVKNLLNIFQTYVTVPAASSMGGLKTMFWEVYVRSFHWVSSGIIQLVGLLFSSHKSMILVIPSYTTSKKGAKDGHSCLPRNEQLLNK